MWGPCLGNKSIIFWIFQRKGPQGPPSSVNCKMELSAYSNALHIFLIFSSAHGLMTSWSCHWIIYWVTKIKIYDNIDIRNMKICMKHPWTQSLRYRKNQLEGPWGGPSWGHKRTISLIFQRKGLQGPPSSVICKKELPAYFIFLHIFLLLLALPLASGQVQSFTHRFCHWFTYWVTKLKISVTIVTKNLKFNMKHPQNQSLRSRQTPLEGQCLGDKRAISKIFQRKDTGSIQQLDS